MDQQSKSIDDLYHEAKVKQASQPQSFKKRPFKILLLGDQEVGKSSLLRKLQDQDYKEQYRATIGADFIAKGFIVNDEPVMLMIWDTAGQERFQSLGNSFYRDTDCCVLVYDITNRQTFENLNMWQDEFIISGNPADVQNFPFVVIGNKVDKEQHRQVPEASSFEASAKDGTNIYRIFTEIAKLLVERTLKA